MVCKQINIFWLGEPLRGLRPLASGYPLHHLHRLRRFGGSATIPLALLYAHATKISLFQQLNKQKQDIKVYYAIIFFNGRVGFFIIYVE